MTNKDFELSMKVIAQLDRSSLQKTIKEAQAEIDSQTQRLKKAQKDLAYYEKKGQKAVEKDDFSATWGRNIMEQEGIINDAKKRIDKAGQAIINSQKVLSQRLIQERKDMYSQLRKINQQESTAGISDADLKALEKQRKQIEGRLSGNTRNINKFGNTDAIEASRQISEQYQTLKLTDSVQRNLSQNSQQMKEAYRLANEYAKEMAQNQQRINALEKSPNGKIDNAAEINQLKQNNEEIQKMRNEKMKIVSQDEQLLKNANEIEARYRRQTDALKSQNNSLKETVSFTEKMKKSIENIGRYVLMYKALNAIETATRSALETVVELDAAFTDIQLVTGETDEQIQQLSEDYNELAKQMGSTTKEVAEGASEWFNESRDHVKVLELLGTP